VSIFVAISVVGLLLIIGLVADGGVKVRAIQQADALAAEAARAAGQVIDVPAAVQGSAVRVNRQGAHDAASAFLAAAGVRGTVTVAPDGEAIQVTVTITRPTVFLSLIGITQVSATGHASVTLVHAVTGAGP
jgi:predicted extracellular nuclease